MTEKPRSQKATGESAPADGLDGQAAVSPGQLLNQVYTLLYNKAVGLMLILLAGLLSLVGVLLPQMPSAVKGDAAQEAQWLESVRPVLGGWTGPLERVGFLSMFSSVPFLVVMGLLAASIAACTVHRLPVLWKAARHPHLRVSDRFFEHARLRAHFTTPVSPQAAFKTVCEDARRHRMRVLVPEPGTGLNAYLDRHAWAPFGTVLAHAAFIVIMVGFTVSSLSGFRDEQFTLTVGYPKAVGHGTTLVAEARSFQDSYYADGSPKDYVADVVLREGDREVASQQVRVNSPLSYGGVMLHQAYFGVAAVLRVLDGSGQEVLHDGVALEWTSRDKVFVFGRTTLPDGRLLYAISPASGQVGTGIEPGQVRVELLETEDAAPLERALVDQGVPVSLGEYTVTFEREKQFTGMILRRDPGTPIVWVGFGMLAVGTFLTMLLRHQRIWVRVTVEDGQTLVQLASPDRRDWGFARLFTEMSVRVSQKMAGDRKRSDEDA